MAIFGWSNANFCIGEGAENSALNTIFNKSIKPITFQKINSFFDTLLFLKAKYAMMGAVIPAIISKFLPSKVISWGIVLLMNNKYNTISTGILTTWIIVNCLSDKLLIKWLPFFETKVNITKINVGNMPITKILGGKTLVLLLYTFLYPRNACTTNQTQSKRVTKGLLLLKSWTKSIKVSNVVQAKSTGI